jgi:putative endonuclease
VIGWLYRLCDTARHRARLRRWNAEQATGRRGEDLAHRYLERRGFTIVARNYRPPSGAGEIDLVAWHSGTLVFVEVKSRTTDDFGSPLRNVDQEKRTALLRAARHYARRAGVPWERVRFDLLSVVFSEPPAMTHFPDAFAPIQTL